MTRKNEEDQGMVLLRCGKAVLLGGVIAFLAGVGLLLLDSLAVSRGLLDSGLRYQLTVVSCVLGSFVGGIFAVRGSPARGLLVGLATGGVLFLLQLSLGLVLYGGLSLESGGFGLLFGDLCGGAAAGILAGGGKKRTGTRGKRHRRR